MRNFVEMTTITVSMDTNEKSGSPYKYKAECRLTDHYGFGRTMDEALFSLICRNQKEHGARVALEELEEKQTA